MDYLDFKRLSLIIPAWNGDQFIGPCLASLQQHAPSDMDLEIIVIDNGSTDQTVSCVRQFPQIRLVCNNRNLGFARAVNQGLHAATGQVLILLNQDIVAKANWVQPLLEQLEQDVTIGIVGSKLLYPDGSVQHAGGYLVDPAREGRHFLDDNPNNRIDFVTGAAFTIRRACWLATGDFDESFSPAYFEDVDYCLRAKQFGWNIGYAAKSVLIHYESQSRGANFDHAANFHMQRFRFVLKHQSYESIIHDFLPYERKRVIHAPNQDFILRYAIAHICIHHMLRIEQFGYRFSQEQLRMLIDELLSLRQLSLKQAIQ